MNKAVINRPLPMPKGYARDTRYSGSTASQSGYKGAKSLEAAIPASTKENLRIPNNTQTRNGTENMVLGQANLRNRA